MFQHFGKTENFKVYETENNEIISSAVCGTDGIGHCALAGLLGDKGIDVLICGGLGMGAQTTLAASGITVIAGAQGNADEAVKNYLNGTLETLPFECDHPHHSCH